MADQEMSSPLGPVVSAPERMGTVYEAKIAQNNARRGPLRFESGIATDTDVPNEFVIGIQQGYETLPGHPNYNNPVFVKSAEETMSERAHVGSAAWTAAPSFLGAFAEGAGAEAERAYVAVERSGGSYMRINPARVND